MLITIPKEDSYLPPAGRFQAICTSVKSFDKTFKTKREKWVRLTFDLEVPGAEEEGIQYKAGVSYSIEKPSALKAALKQWLGKAVRGKSIDTDSWTSQRATVEISHVENAGHENAYRWLSNIDPPIALRINTEATPTTPSIEEDYSTDLPEAA